MNLSYLSKRDWSLLIGNALDHFDAALYGFLAPILAPLFFPNYDPVVQLVLAYSVFATSLITRPLGAFVFGVLAHKKNPVHVLSFSLIGVAIATVAIGFLPTYQQIGWSAPLFLIFARFIRGVFAAGDGTIAKLYILENKSREQSLSLSHLYQSFSVLGTILASFFVTVITWAQNPVDYWRMPFWAGAFTALVGVYLRWDVVPSLPESPQSEAFEKKSLSILWQERLGIIRIFLVTNVSWLTYAIPFVFLNTFIPLITNITFSQMMMWNTVFLMIDMLLIPFFGEISKKFPVKQVMRWSGLALSLSILPLFYFLEGASFLYVTVMRLWIIGLGLIYLCPLHVFYLDQFQGNKKYLLIGMGNALSAATVGKLTPAICLFLWHKTSRVWAPAFYMFIFFLMGLVALYYSLPKSNKSKIQN